MPVVRRQGDSSNSSRTGFSDDVSIEISVIEPFIKKEQQSKNESIESKNFNYSNKNN